LVAGNIEETFEWACAQLRSAGIDPASQEGRRRLVSNSGYLSLRDVELVGADPSMAACAWVQGDINGPQVKVYEPIDGAGWLVSESSAWLGDDMRAALLQGIAEWAVWPNFIGGKWLQWEAGHFKPAPAMND
jgi:hypothetical protein